MRYSMNAMRKLITGMLVLVLLALSSPGPAMAQGLVACESDYVVRAGDWLTKIADEQYGDASLYPAIVLATNGRSGSDDGYATIADPWLIEPGWKLCIPSVEAARAGLTMDLLKNGEYQSEFTASGKALLIDGKYQESAAPGSATKIVVMLSDRMAFGYSGESQEMAALILITDPGGSGTFYHLAIVVEQDGGMVNVATTLLGDRVKINSLSIEGGAICVNMITQGPDDPFCCPTQQVMQKYALQGDQLTQTLEKIIGKVVALEGTPWTLDAYVNSQGDLVSVLSDTQITAEFQDGQVTGNAGCNSYFGPYEGNGNSLTVGLLGVTQRYCAPEALMAQEGEYLAALQSAVSYRIMDGKLQIANADGEIVLTFSVLEHASLTGTTWQLSGYNNGKGGFVSVLAGTEITAIFGDDGKVAGSAGCNNYTTSYVLEGDAIMFGPVATTRKMCAEPKGIMEQESAFLAALESATALQIKGDQLELMGADGVRVATFIASDSGNTTS